MPRRVKQTPSLLSPITTNLVKRLSDSNSRFRRRFIRIGFLVIGMLFFYSLLSGTYGIPRIIRLELERRAMIMANQRELTDLIDAARIKRLLENDPAYIEYIARTRYHMVFPGEVIYRYRGQ